MQRWVLVLMGFAGGLGLGLLALAAASSSARPAAASDKPAINVSALLEKIEHLEARIDLLEESGSPGDGDLVVGRIVAESISAKQISVWRDGAATAAYLDPERIGFVEEWQRDVLTSEKMPTAGWCFLSPGALRLATHDGPNEIWLMSDSDGHGGASLEFKGKGGASAVYGMSSAGRLLVRGATED